MIQGVKNLSFSLKVTESNLINNIYFSSLGRLKASWELFFGGTITFRLCWSVLKDKGRQGLERVEKGPIACIYREKKEPLETYST